MYLFPMIEIKKELKDMGRKSLIIIIFFLSFVISMAQEEIYVSLRSKGLKNDFFPLYQSENEVFISIEDLTAFLDLNKITIENSMITGEIDGEEINKSFIFEENFIKNNKTYINIDNIDKVIPMKEVVFNNEMYILNITPDFLLNYEIEKERLEKRRSLSFSGDSEEEEIDYYSEQRKLFNLGMLSMDYSRSDFSRGEEILTLGYSSQLLYGDFTIDGEVYDESELNYVNLEYEEVNFLGGKNVTFGDFYLRTYSALKIESSLRGISIYGNEAYGRKENGKIIIDGSANGVDTVELYQNGILINYQNITNNSYEFEVRTITSDAEYKIIKYYPNGTMKEEKVYLLSDTQIFTRGEWDYVLQAGRGIEYDQDQYMYNVKYGFTDNLTLGLGNSFFTGDDGKNYDIIEGNFAYRTGALKFPSMIIGDYLYDTDEDDGSLFLNFTQKVGDYTFELLYENYNKKLAEDNSLDEKYELSFGRSYRKFEYNTKYSWEEYESEKYQELGLDLYYRMSNYRLSSINTYEMHDNSDNRYSINLGLDYTGHKYLNINLRSEFEFYDSEVDESYAIRVSRRGGRSNKTHYFDVAAELEYDSSLMATLEVTYYFDGFIRLNVPLTVTDEETTTGISVEKTIDLKNPIGLQYIKDRDSFVVEGIIFRDANGNSILDSDEEVMSGVIVKIGGETAITDDNGVYLLQNITANSIEEIQLERSSLDPTLESGRGEMYIKGHIGEKIKYDIPLIPLSSIGGNIKIVNEGKEEMRNIFDRTIIDFLQNGQVMYSTSLEFDGFYVVDKIIPGAYDVEITYLGSAKEVNIIGNKTLNIPKDSDGDFYEVDYNIEIKETEEIK